MYWQVCKHTAQWARCNFDDVLCPNNTIALIGKPTAKKTLVKISNLRCEWWRKVDVAAQNDKIALHCHRSLKPIKSIMNTNTMLMILFLQLLNIFGISTFVCYFVVEIQSIQKHETIFFSRDNQTMKNSNGKFNNFHLFRMKGT